MFDLAKLQNEVSHCTECPRLIKYCSKVAIQKRKAFRDQDYWGKPVPAFGKADAQLFILGLAPAAHGANRTGRPFTGDRSGEWLYRALHKFGFANQPHSESRHDGLVLMNTVISCAVKCAPPQNKPSPLELKTCEEKFLRQEINLFDNVRVYLTLGQIAWKSLLRVHHPNLTHEKFSHGKELSLGAHRFLLGSYHPSQQNTFTKRLTEPMFDSVFSRARALLETKALS